MTDELSPCAHCGGNWAFGWSQRVIGGRIRPSTDVLQINASTAPVMNDMEARSLSEPPTEKLCCILCEDCGMQTPWIPFTDNKHAALDEAGKIWNTRLNRPAASEGDLLDLVRKEISPIDAPYVLDLLARTAEDWEKRGPILSMLAQKIVDGKITTRDFWPIDPVLEDAARYRTLQQMARFVYIDGVASVQFPRIPATGGDEECSFETRVSAAVDDLPDRNRW
ncbi:Lar family restriction alleviation protein [Paraburkholderia sp. MMS20-SJTR3]|uniref:Lar family restriction alleviation protein n=1 Tax=Paraburkholderia sejongensis TaxID=2886946 RepID=A0ABS8K5J7_9BURK|nr:Lar family restriction alleviation protein [Paraburkholderia sp. MMS20-SJTR3]MCC8397275.1 Lar family restriction alleviation protein [Paraburkholderia sp. MMS20-SJTR3]